MLLPPTFRFSRTFISCFLITLAACSNQQEVALQPIHNEHSNILPGTQARETPDQILTSFQLYQQSLTAIKNNDDVLPAQFLASQPASAMSNTIRNLWLQRLGKQGNWTLFQQQYSQLEPESRDRMTCCYAGLGHIDQDTELLHMLNNSTENLPEGCNRWLEQAASEKITDPNRSWRRVRSLLSMNQITNARNLAAALGSPLPEPLSNIAANTAGTQEALLYQVISKENSNKTTAANLLEQLSTQLTPEQIGFAWGQLGLMQAYKQNASLALTYFDKAAPEQMSVEMWQWYARSALRLQHWGKLAAIIEKMPADIKREKTWQYWLGRSYQQQGQSKQAQQLFRQVANSGHDFYSLLAKEELGEKINTRNNTAEIKQEETKLIANDGNINRALVFFQSSEKTGDWALRHQAQQEWRFAIRHYNEDTLLASSQLAYDNGFYEMGILSAEKTRSKINYNLRYITPFKDIITLHAKAAKVDPAWVYGLIRQESRFMIGVKSHVGATGLMQVMPATANEIARKLGISSEHLHNIDGNVRMGTWFLGDIRNRLGDEVLATTGYNGGPTRARRWKAEMPLEGAIYAETIPYNETRTYVKNVMANATYYASILHEPQISLRKRMGTVPAK